MKILPKLKEKLQNAKTCEEKKQVFLDVGIELDEKELEYVDGGAAKQTEMTLPKDFAIETPKMETSIRDFNEPQ